MEIDPTDVLDMEIVMTIVDGRLGRIEQLHIRCLLIAFLRGFGSG